MRVRISSSVCVTAVLALLFAFAAYAQVSTGSITGTVTDAQGAAMVGANVVVRNTDTGGEKTGTTNESGSYTVSLLQPGRYDVTATQTGFATVQRTGVTVQVGQTVRIDVEMPVASQQSLVTVTTEVPLLETERTAQSQNVSENLVDNLPVSSRRWEQFVLLTPGVNPDGNGGGMSFGGINNLYNSNSVDGANNNSHYNGGARGGPTNDGYAYSGEAIREFQVSSSNFTAEVGQAAGGAVNAVTKSGTNTWHGSAFENLRNPIFNAYDPVGKTNAAIQGLTPQQPVKQQNQFGGSIGGPIVRDKLFFFAVYDGYRKVNPNSVNVEGAAGIANLRCPNPVPAPGQTTFVSAAQCAAAKNYVLTNVVGDYEQYLRQDVEFIKLDYQLNAAHHLNVAANARDWKQPTAGNGGGAPGSTTNFLLNRFVIATWNTVIGTNKVNEARFQYGIDNSWVGLPNVGGRPQVAVGSLFTYGSVNVPAYVNEFRHQISDNFSITKGTHALKMGVDINLIRNPTRGSNQSAGVYRYSAAVAIAPAWNSTGCPSTGDGAIFCGWLLDLYGVNIGDGRTGTHWATYNQILDTRGAPAGSVPFAPGFAPPDGRVPPETFVNVFKMQDYAGYFQDTWKARPNLTLNLGVRYDVQNLPPPQHVNTASPLVTHFTEIGPSDYSGIQPRIGIAYNFTQRTVLRVGGGLFVGKTPGNLYKAFQSASNGAQIACNPTGARSCTNQLHLASSNPFLFPDVMLDQQDVGTHHPYTDPAMRPSTIQIPVVNSTFPQGICPCGIRGIDPESKRPRAYQAQLAIERQLPGNMNFTGAYIFTRGLNLPSSVDANIKNTGLQKSYDVVNSSGVTELVSTVPFFTERLDTRATNIIAQFTGVSSRYHGMALSLRKPMSRGFEILTNYTLSRATDDGQAGLNSGGENFFATDGVLNPFDRSGEQGYSQTDARNRFTASVIWQPSYGRNASSRVVRALADGWTMSSTVTASNGTRYNAQVQSTASQTLGSATALQGGMTGALVATGGNSIGGRVAWLPHNGFSLPSYTNVDFRVAKHFAITERYAFELRGEAFNLFNSTIVQAVSLNAYTFAAPNSTSAVCPSIGANAHTNTCMIPVGSGSGSAFVGTFGNPTTTTGNLLGARQFQFGARFSF